jgi:broad specificity phosphatase PhoE
MTAVYVLRHPETTWNVAERYQGRLESPLSAEGRRQCQLTVRAFEDGPLDAVYSSPLGRALELARSLAGATEARLVVDQRLTEIAQGPWEGLYRAEIRQRYADLAQTWYETPDTVRFPGGESLGDVQERAISVLARIYDRHPDQNVCIVTHSVVVQVLAATILCLPLRHLHRIHVSNAGVTTLCGTAAPGALRSLNATGHLFTSPMASATAQKCVSETLSRKAS